MGETTLTPEKEPMEITSPRFLQIEHMLRLNVGREPKDIPLNHSGNDRPRNMYSGVDVDVQNIVHFINWRINKVDRAGV